MKSIGIIDQDRLQNIPSKSQAAHEFCFHLHDMMTGLLFRMEVKKAKDIEFKIETEADIELLNSGIHPLDFLEQSGRLELERRAVVNHVCVALYADMLHFIYEALRALEKRKFSVAYSLLRKPFKEGMLIAAQMCADEAAFFKKMKTDARNLLNRKELDEPKVKALLEAAILACKGSDFAKADLIYDAAFRRGNEFGLAGLFDKATHLVTEFSQIRTENYNLNLIFKNPEDNDVYEGDTYRQIAMLLLFLNIMLIQLY